MTRRAPVLATLAGLAALLASTSALAGLDIETWQTRNGARVLFVAAPEIPMFDLRVVFAGGSARDGTSPGLARLANAMLREGAGERDADAFSSALGATGAVLGSGAERDMAHLSLRSLVEPRYAEPAVALFVDALARPRFDAAALERVKARALIGLKHKQQSPEDIAEDTFYASLYAEHPYASPPEGTEAGVSALDAAALRAFHARYYVAQNAVVAIVGALDRARAEALAEQVTAPLAAGEKAAALPEVPPPASAEKRVE